MCAVKPPLGILPELLWKENRIRELSMAIGRYTQEGCLYDAHHIAILNWMAELSKLLVEIQHLKKKGL